MIRRYDAARVMYGMTNCMRCRCGDDLSLVSADQFGSYIEIPGGNIRVPLGYVGVLAPLLRDLPSCCVRFVQELLTLYFITLFYEEIRLNCNIKKNFCENLTLKCR